MAVLIDRGACLLCTRNKLPDTRRRSFHFKQVWDQSMQGRLRYLIRTHIRPDMRYKYIHYIVHVQVRYNKTNIWS